MGRKLQIDQKSDEGKERFVDAVKDQTDPLPVPDPRVSLPEGSNKLIPFGSTENKHFIVCHSRLIMSDAQFVNVVLLTRPITQKKKKD